MVSHPRALAATRVRVPKIDRRTFGLGLGVPVLLGLPGVVHASGGILVSVSGSTPDSMWSRRTVAHSPGGEIGYSDTFVAALTGFLVVHDAALRSWWVAQAKLISPELRPPAVAARRADQFAALAASVQGGLGRFPGAAGAAQLFDDLAGGYGGRSPGSLRQVCALFALVVAPEQPTAAMAAALAGAEVEPRPGSLATPAAADACVFPEDLRLLDLAERLTLKPRPTWKQEAEVEKAFGPFEAVVPAGWDLRDLAQLVRGPASATSMAGGAAGGGRVAAAAAARERALGPRAYGAFLVAGACASGLAHAAVTL